MKLESRDLIGKDGMMNKEFTVDGKDVSPELVWSDVPAGTKSFALYVHDPDAPDPKKPLRDWIHWMIINIPATFTKIPKGGPAPGEELVNDGGEKNYGGPSPPRGVHRYFFKVFALKVDKLAGVTKETFLKKIEPAKLAEAEIMAKYGRK
nr:YbhB/YbcL family Raf kinase inhibitor-like protein [Candidatus Sigynarchaeota archaeon]